MMNKTRLAAQRSQASGFGANRAVPRGEKPNLESLARACESMLSWVGALAGFVSDLREAGEPGQRVLTEADAERLARHLEQARDSLTGTLERIAADFDPAAPASFESVSNCDLL
jgi:hypothetical protein